MAVCLVSVPDLAPVQCSQLFILYVRSFPGFVHAVDVLKTRVVQCVMSAWSQQISSQPAASCKKSWTDDRCRQSTAGVNPTRYMNTMFIDIVVSILDANGACTIPHYDASTLFCWLTKHMINDVFHTMSSNVSCTHPSSVSALLQVTASVSESLKVENIIKYNTTDLNKVMSLQPSRKTWFWHLWTVNIRRKTQQPQPYNTWQHQQFVYSIPIQRTRNTACKVFFLPKISSKNVIISVKNCRGTIAH
jgi:hypothetical protein